MINTEGVDASLSSSGSGDATPPVVTQVFTQGSGIDSIGQAGGQQVNLSQGLPSSPQTGIQLGGDNALAIIAILLNLIMSSQANVQQKMTAAGGQLIVASTDMSIQAAQQQYTAGMAQAQATQQEATGQLISGGVNIAVGVLSVLTALSALGKVKSVASLVKTPVGVFVDFAEKDVETLARAATKGLTLSTDEMDKVRSALTNLRRVHPNATAEEIADTVQKAIGKTNITSANILTNLQPSRTFMSGTYITRSDAEKVAEAAYEKQTWTGLSKDEKEAAIKQVMQQAKQGGSAENIATALGQQGRVNEISEAIQGISDLERGPASLARAARQFKKFLAFLRTEQGQHMLQSLQSALGGAGTTASAQLTLQSAISRQQAAIAQYAGESNRAFAEALNNAAHILQETGTKAGDLLANVLQSLQQIWQATVGPRG